MNENNRSVEIARRNWQGIARIREIRPAMIMVGAALVVRVFGMLGDATTRESTGLVRAEAVMLVLFIVGVFIELARRNQQRQGTWASNRDKS